MIEAAVEMDDDALGAYLDGKEPDIATLKKCIRKATVTRAFYPMLCGSAFKNKGVQPLLDAVVDYLPAPADREAYKGIDVKTGEPTERKPLDSEPLSHAGVQDHELRARRLDHLLPRLFGHPRSGHGAAEHHARQEGARRPHVPDARRRARGDQGGLHRRHRRAVRPQGYAHRRDAVRPSKPVLLEKMEFPNPVIEMSIEPKTKADQEKMAWRCMRWRLRIRRSASASTRSCGRDHPQGHGRAASRYQGRHPEAHARR